MANDRQQRAARAEQMRKDREKANRRQRNVITIAIVAVVAVLVGLAGFAIKGISDDNANDTALNTPKNATKDYGIVYDAKAAGGTAKADPVKVEVYEDFQCPICQAFEQANSELLKGLVKSGDITLVYKPFSFLDDTGGSPNKYSARSTNLAMCALNSGGVADYLKVHDYLYANQPEEGTPGPEDNELVKAADGLGLSGLDACVKSEKYGKWIDDARDAGSDRGVSGTPAVYVAGKALENPTSANLQQAIAAAAKKS